MIERICKKIIKLGCLIPLAIFMLLFLLNAVSAIVVAILELSYTI